MNNADVGDGVETRKVFFTGRVQGVGFRATVASLASQYPALGGYVRNLIDGRVELVASADPAVLDGFIAEVAERMRFYIREMDTTLADPSQTFDRFEIRPTGAA